MGQAMTRRGFLWGATAAAASLAGTFGPASTRVLAQANEATTQDEATVTAITYLTVKEEMQQQAQDLIVPRTPPNNAEEPAADVVEGRERTEGNSPEGHGARTQRRTHAPEGIERVRQTARRSRKQRFTALLHHVYDIDRLRVLAVT